MYITKQTTNSTKDFEQTSFYETKINAVDFRPKYSRKFNDDFVEKIKNNDEYVCEYIVNIPKNQIIPYLKELFNYDGCDINYLKMKFNGFYLDMLKLNQDIKNIKEEDTEKTLETNESKILTHLSYIKIILSEMDIYSDDREDLERCVLECEKIIGLKILRREHPEHFKK